MLTIITPIIKSIILVTAGFLLLRLAGRKSVSQMTIGQTVVMISIGSIIIEPIATEKMYNTLAAALTFILVLILLEYLEVKFPVVENFLAGKSKVLIKDGKIDETNLKKLRLTVDKLEMRLREKGITNLADVKTATLEPNGQLGYELKRSAQPLTIGEFEKAIGYLFEQNYQPSPNKFDLFDEIKEDRHQKTIRDKLK